MKLCLQKRLETFNALFGKTSRLLLFAGSQRIAVRSLEGNQVAVRGNMPTVLFMGNRFYWQQEVGTGEIQPDHMAQGLRCRLPSFYFIFLHIEVGYRG